VTGNRKVNFSNTQLGALQKKSRILQAVLQLLITNKTPPKPMLLLDDSNNIELQGISYCCF
jgi:hypothetical protein